MDGGKRVYSHVFISLIVSTEIARWTAFLFYRWYGTTDRRFKWVLSDGQHNWSWRETSDTISRSFLDSTGAGAGYPLAPQCNWPLPCRVCLAASGEWWNVVAAAMPSAVAILSRLPALARTWILIPTALPDIGWSVSHIQCRRIRSKSDTLDSRYYAFFR